MSRIGKQPIEVPQGINVKIDGRTVNVEGPKGKIETKLPSGLQVKMEDGKVECTLEKGADRSNYGLGRSLVSNSIEGCASGFKKQLQIVGVGYRASVSGDVLDLALGFSHPIHYKIPEGIKIDVDKQGLMTIEGVNKQLVGQVAADIRSYREPEPYKGKGVKYADERVVRKAGKAGGAGSK